MAEHCASAFGLRWRSDIPLDAFDAVACPASEPCDVEVRRVASLAKRSPLRPINSGYVYRDGIRLVQNGRVGFDMFDGRRIEYLPGPGWQEALPSAFYSTLAALILAWRGALPFHASAVEVAGGAILIAGRSGAGKSSLVAGLLDRGARFVADDLTAVRSRHEDHRLEVLRGRPAMRQHRDTATRIDADPPMPSAGDPRGKWLVTPRARTPETILPLGGIIALTESGSIAGPERKLAFIAGQLFRPRWLAALPNHALRRQQLLALLQAVPVVGFPAVKAFSASDQAARAERAFTQIETMIEARNRNS